MNPDSPKTPHEEMEIRLIALLLGELPDEEAAAWRAAIATNPELAKLHDRLKQTISLVREATAEVTEPASAQVAPLKLSDERRQKLFAHFKTVAPKELVPEKRQPKFRLVELAAVLVIVGFLASVVLSTWTNSRSHDDSSVATFGSGSSQVDAASSGSELVQQLSQDSRSVPAQFAGGGPSNVYSLNVVGYVNKVLPTKSVQQESRQSADREPGVTTTSPASPAPPPFAQIVLPSAVDSESLGATEAPKVATTFDGRHASVAPPMPAEGGVQLRYYQDLNRGPVINPTTGLPAATPESDFADFLADAQRRLADKSDGGIIDNRVQVSGQVGSFYRDLTRSPAPTLSPPTAGAAIAINGVDRPSVASYGVQPTTESSVDRLALGEAAATAPGYVTADNQAFRRRYGLESPGGQGGAGGGGAIAGGTALAVPQIHPGQAVAGDVVAVAGFEVSPASTLQPAKPQEPPAPTLTEPTEVNGDKVPVLGELPTLGKLFRSDAAGGRGRATTPPSRGQVANAAEPSLGTLAYDVDPNTFHKNLDRVSGFSRGDINTAGGTAGGINAAKSDYGIVAEGRTPPVDAAEESLRRQSSSIVLPQVQMETSLAQNGRPIPGRPMRDDTTLNVDAAKSTEISDLDAQSSVPMPTMGAETLRRLKEQWTEAKSDLVKEETQLEELEKLPPDRRRAALQTTVGPDNELNKLIGESNSAEQTLLRLQKDYSLDHPDYINAQKLVEDSRRRVNQRVDGVMTGLSNRVSVVQSVVKRLNENLEKAGSTDTKKAERARPYYEAKQHLEELQRFRQVLYFKMASTKIDVDLPRSMLVEILDQAKPASAPEKSLWGTLTGKQADFASTARIKIERDSTDIPSLSAPSDMAMYDPYFVQSESEVIQSQAVLRKVAETLRQDEAWAKRHGGEKLNTAEAIALLKKKIEVRSVPNTSLLEIRAKSDKPEEAAKIANAVAAAYRDHRLEKGRQLAMRGIKTLKEQFDEQELKVREAQKEVDRLRRELSVSAFVVTSTTSSTPSVEADVTPIRKPSTNAPIAQPEIQTSENAFSTFSLNVSDVSFKLAAASLEKGQMPDQASVRSEEFINAFDYRDPEPPPGVPIAFAWERARYPFAQNRDLLRFSVKTAAAGRQVGRPLNIVLLLDNSGSMERADRIQIIREALAVLAGQLQPQDKLSVITFARTARLWVDGVPGNQAGEVADQVSGLTPQGGTNLEDAMNLAYQTALRHYLATGINRVVLLTDGAANLGNVEPESLKEKVEAHRKQGVALDCFGIGWEGFNDDLLEVLSRNGDGRYGFINSPEEAATEFAGQLAGVLKVAASDVKVQVEFNPARVTAYRQIGYAKHQLTKEQFRDNTVDAAEIAAQEAGNALYTVEVNPAGEGPLAIVRVRFKIPGTADYPEHEWAVPFTGNAVSLEQASPAMRLTATASAFSEWLVASPFAGEVTPDSLLGYLSGVPEVYRADARPKKLEWMIRQAKSIEGK